MSVRHSFHGSPLIVTLLISLSAHATQIDIVNSQTMPGFGPSEKLNCLYHSRRLGEQECQSYRMAQRTNAYPGAGFRGKPVR